MTTHRQRGRHHGAVVTAVVVATVWLCHGVQAASPAKTIWVAAGASGANTGASCGDTAAAPCATLAAALTRITDGATGVVNGTLNIAPSVPVATAPYVISGPILLKGASSLTLNGGGSGPRPYVSCAAGTQAFTAQDTAKLVLTHLQFQGCGSYALDGGLASATGSTSITLQDSVVQYFLGRNGAVLAVDRSVAVTLFNCTIASNRASSAGGVLYSRLGAASPSTVHLLKQSTLRNNTALNGGVLYAGAGQTVQVVQSTLLNNVANRDGGVLWFSGSYTTSLGVVSSTFTSNTATGYGGVVMYSTGGVKPTIAFTSSVFQLNQARSGGVVASNTSVILSSSQSTFASNGASVNGGCIRVSATSTSTVSIVGGQVTLNKARNGNGGFMDVVCSSVTFSVQGAVLQGNTATNYGGVAAVTGSITVQVNLQTSKFIQNTAYRGGSVYVSATSLASTANVVATGCTITSNHATLSGGFLYGSASDSVSLLNCVATNNRADRYGAVFLLSSMSATTVRITGGFYQGNTAYTGGIADLSTVTTPAGPSTLIADSAVFLNNAGSWGGGCFYLSEIPYVVFRNVTASGNSALPATGGVLYADSLTGAVINVTNSYFARNTAESGGVLELDKATSVTVPNRVYIANVTAIANTVTGDGAFLDAKVTNVVVQSSNISANVAQGYGAFGMLTDINSLSVTDSYIMSNSGLWAGVLWLQSVSSVTPISTSSVSMVFERTLISGNSASFTGGVMYLRVSSVPINAVFRSTIFRNNQGNNGGVVFCEAPAVRCALTFVNSVLDHNSAVSGGGVVALSRQGGTTATFSNVIMSRNYATFGGVIYGVGNKHIVNVRNCQFSSNSANQGGAIWLNSATLSITNSVARGCSAEYSGFAELDGTAVASFNNLTAISCSSGQGGGVTNPADEAVLTVRNSVFQNCSSGTRGGAIYGSETAFINVTDSRFEANSAQLGGAMSIGLQSQLVCVRCSFVRNKALIIGGAVHTSSYGQATLNQSSLVANHAAEEGGATYQDGNSVIALRSTTLSENYAVSGGGSWVQEFASLVSIGSQFIGNYASSGGAIGVIDDAVATINSTVFSDNAASTYGGGLSIRQRAFVLLGGSVTFSGNNAQFGGAMTFDPSASFQVTGVKTCSLVSNIATQAGGAIFVQLPVGQLTVGPLGVVAQSFIDVCTASGNHAIYGNMLATSPTALVLTNKRPSGHSGQVISPPLLFILQDAFNHSILGTETACIVQLSSVSVGALASDLLSKGKGGASFSSVAVFGRPGTQKQLIAEVIQPDGVPSTPFSVALLDCQLGDELVDNECKSCRLGMFSPRAGEECIVCPKFAWCPGGALVYAQAGAWRTNYTHNGEQLPLFVTCPNPQSCLGAIVSQNGSAVVQQGCAEGYAGPLCSACDSGAGFARSGSHQCAPCLSPHLNSGVVAIVAIAAMTLAVTLVQLQRKSAHAAADVAALALKIATSYLQFVSVAVSLTVAWPAPLRSLFSVQTSVGTMGSQLAVIQCLIQGFVDDPTDGVFYEALLYVMLAPVIVALGALFWGVVWTYRRFFRHTEIRTPRELMKITRHNFIVTSIVMLFLLYPSITLKSYLNDGGNFQYLVSDARVMCYDDRHWWWLSVLGAPALLIIVFGIPVAGAVLLRALRDRLQDRDVRAKYGFLYKGYTPPTYFWDVVRLVRVATVIFTVELLARFGTIVQVAGALSVSFFVFWLHMLWRPYIDARLNALETFCLVAAFMTFALGTLLNDFTPGWLQIAVFVVIIMMNATVIVYMLRTFWRDFVKAAKQKAAYLAFAIIRRPQKKVQRADSRSNPLYSNRTSGGSNRFKQAADTPVAPVAPSGPPAGDVQLTRLTQSSAGEVLQWQ